jgi:hypothetical protein
MLSLAGAAVFGGAMGTALSRVVGADDEVDPDLDPGYDPTIVEPIDELLPALGPLPPRAMVDRKYLPPVGAQGTTSEHGYPGSCVAWGGTYGLTTFTAARAGNYQPNRAILQASPAYIYIQVLNEMGVASGECSGSKFSDYFDILKQGGTASMRQARYRPDCKWLWDTYLDADLPPDPAFTLEKVATVPVASPIANNPLYVKSILATGKALAYGTKLYTDFGPYDGAPVPFVGNKQIVMKKQGGPAGHCMLIIGYDDTIGKSGAVLLQNSFGPTWGGTINPTPPRGGRDCGYVWMADETFTVLAQGQAIYVVDT